MNWLSFLLDLALMGLLVTGIMYAVRLMRQLAEMRASRNEMERFVIDFSATVTRAENGIKGLKAAARSSGDDLEKLIEKAHALRDELHFLVDSADQIATRLSDTASAAARQKAESASKPAPKPMAKPVAEDAPRKTPAQALSALAASANSTAEKDLLRALKKIG